MGRKMVRQRAEKMSQDTGFMPISVRMVRGSEDAACLDRMAKVYGTRSDALRAAIHALEGRRTHMAASVALGRAEAAEKRAEALAAEVAQLQSYRAEAEAAAHFAQSVAHLLASPGAEAEVVQHLRADDLPHLLDCLRGRLILAATEPKWVRFRAPQD